MSLYPSKVWQCRTDLQFYRPWNLATAEEIREGWLLKAWDRDEASKFSLLSTELPTIVNKLFSRTLWHLMARTRLIQFLFHTYGVDEVAAAIKAKKNALEV